MKRILLAICLSLMCLSWNGNAEATNWVACPNNATMFRDADSQEFSGNIYQDLSMGSANVV